MSRRTRKNAAVDKQRVFGWILGICGVLIIAIFAGVGIYLTENSRDTDRISSCPKGNLDSVTLVLIDLTDPINPVQAAALRNALLEVRDSIPQYGRLEIYPLSSAKQTAIPPLFAACNPGNGRDVSSPLSGNAQLADRIWQKQFADKIDAIIAKVETLPPEQNSPILEAIQSVSVTGFGAPTAQTAASKRLILVSDMLHYTPELSMYNGAPQFDEFRASQYYLRVKPDLRGAKVDVYLIVRETKHAAQQPPLYKFWTDYFDAAGGYLRGWEPLQ